MSQCGTVHWLSWIMGYHMYKTAIDIQDACNISGVIGALNAAKDEINKEMRDGGYGEEYRRKHPVILLYISKICNMLGVEDPVPFSEYAHAYRICKEKAS